MRLALHEALANGLVHGNLEIESDPDLTPTTFLEHAAVLESRLASPDYGRRPIELTAVLKGPVLEITVRDSGTASSPSRPRRPTIASVAMASPSWPNTATDSDWKMTDVRWFSVTVPRMVPAMSRNLGACHVLVVEDDVSIQQLLISHFLESMGIVDIAFAQDGIEGLEKARRRLPDLIVLDIEMPRMNGLEMLRHLKADPKLHGIPVIVQTAEESRDKREQMFEAGATDFVLKPLSINEFQGRIRVHIENLLHVRRLQADLARIAQELEDAAGLQRELLPTADVLAAVSSRYGLKISHVFEPSSELGGDFWGLLPINDHAVGIFICDFAGHGVSAAMNTFRLQTILDRLPLPDPENPAAYVAAVNQDLCKALSNRHYATFLFAVIDLAINRLHYASGAAPDPLTGRRGHAELKTLNGSGLLAGHQQ